MRQTDARIQTAEERQAAADCWRLISAGALPPATAIAPQGQPTWDLPSILSWTGITLEAAIQALKPGADQAAADQARARQPLAGPDLGYGAISWQHKKSPTPSKPRPLRIKPARQG